MPTYNSAETISASIESLLGQSYADFELIVSDNASTDLTREVVEALAHQDQRIRYVRQPENAGVCPNYTYVAQVARGEFFKWSTSSDWCAPTFLERCLDELLTHDDAVLVAPRTRLFQTNLSTAQDYALDIDLLDDEPSARLMSLIRTLALNNAMNGLIRMSALRDTRLVEPYIGADIVLMGHLALLGKFRLVDERLFYRRMDPKTATVLQDVPTKWRHHYPRQSARTLFQGCKRQLGWVRTVLSAEMSIGERLRCLETVARQCYYDRRAFLEDLNGLWSYCTRATWPLKLLLVCASLPPL